MRNKSSSSVILKRSFNDLLSGFRWEVTDVLRAGKIEKIRRFFESSIWAELSPSQRKHFLIHFARLDPEAVHTHHREHPMEKTAEHLRFILGCLTDTADLPENIRENLRKIEVAVGKLLPKAHPTPAPEPSPVSPPKPSVTSSRELPPVARHEAQAAQKPEPLPGASPPPVVRISHEERHRLVRQYDRLMETSLSLMPNILGHHFQYAQEVDALARELRRIEEKQRSLRLFRRKDQVLIRILKRFSTAVQVQAKKDAILITYPEFGSLKLPMYILKQYRGLYRRYISSE